MNADDFFTWQSAEVAIAVRLAQIGHVVVHGDGTVDLHLSHAPGALTLHGDNARRFRRQFDFIPSPAPREPSS